ncbi:MAG TPA: type I glyceraldehyde-3-phosphate dehydrogenase [Candidatus Paceibacterota bacterium]|nr:type I glyceraldehyde-3-phosphate dehydrogenase [Candidatus Paceibacterota bacterium]
MKTVRIGINGFGRIGRAFFRAAHWHPGLQVVAINDLADTESLAYLLSRDSVYGKSPFPVASEPGSLIVAGRRIPVSKERDPALISWKNAEADVVLESTGVFEKYADARKHLQTGAKRVIITAPAKDEPPADLKAGTVLVGVNEEKFATCEVTSNGSCTTNAGSPLLAILHESLGVEKALLNTVHAYTATQSLVDSPAKGDFRRGRAGAHNIVPSSTGAAIAVTKALSGLAGKFDGIAIRVPVISGSLVDITFVAKRDTTAEEVNGILSAAAKEPRWQKTFSVTHEPLVSSDIVGMPYAAIADLEFTRVVGGNLVKVLAWYDNEMGYAHTLIEHVKKLSQNL